MPVQTTVETASDRAVVVKRAVGGATAIEQLRREGERLRRAQHPGVVPLLRSAPTTDGWELVMGHGGRSLSTLRGAGAAQLAGLVAGAASTLADLHEMGITHGRIDASHVLVSDSGRPLLCGLGGGQRRADPEQDVAMLGALLAELVGTDDEPEPIPDRRWRPRRGWHGWERRALLLLADQATADEPGRRPTARRLAAAIAEAVPPGDQLRRVAEIAQPPPDGIEGLRPADEPANRPRARRVGAMLLALGCALLALAVLEPSAGQRPSLAPAGPEGTSEVRVAEPVPGSVLEADGRRYLVGQAGDHLLVGDWSCDGSSTPAAFRPSTQEVFVFDRWAGADEVAVDAIATVPEGIALESEAGSVGCPDLSVRTAGGALVSVDLDGLR